MNGNKKALLLVGSPKSEKSTSASLGNYLCSKLEGHVSAIDKRYIHRIYNHEEKIKELVKLINNTDIIVLSFPLYIDCLPAPVIKTMELIKEERDKLENKNAPFFIAICNNGFPESSQIKLALRICRIISEECGFTWKGGFAAGGGGAINGAPLKRKSGPGRFYVKGFDIAANSLKDDEDIPQKAFDTVSKKAVSYNMYRIFANLGFRLELHPTYLAVMIISGVLLLILGTPITIIGAIDNDPMGLNIGIAFLIIGLNLFINGIVFRMNIKKRSSI
ncbi:MAG: hypothetical protein JW891_04585 [Candidatus Lokiarchaeota archaeon]|nr:hypothetical protein [Candidatus Lokiarchaeota archaeon]